MKKFVIIKQNACGIIYVSFKYGDFVGERNGRYFTDMTETSMGRLLEEIPELKAEDPWINGDMRADREKEKWLNMILRKSERSDHECHLK